MIKYDPGFTLNDVHLLKLGRYFRLSPGLKLVVGRNEEENQKIQTFSQMEDLLFKISHYPGPLSLLRGEASSDDIADSAAITVRYSKAKGLRAVKVAYKRVGEDSYRSLWVSSMKDEKIREKMIGE